MNKANELSRWQILAMEHWRQFQPSRYRKLMADGTLATEALAAARMTLEEMERMMRTGATWDEAWEATRQLWLFPPEERAATEERMPMLPAHRVMADLNRALRRNRD